MAARTFELWQLSGVVSLPIRDGASMQTTTGIAVIPSLPDRVKAVQQFDERHGESERVLWVLAQGTRPELLAGEAGPVLDALTWTLKSWWGVQGVATASRRPLAEAIAGLGWTEAILDDRTRPAGLLGKAEWVEVAVADACARGAARKEFSLVSKVLHWLLPWQVPIYDNYVRAQLGVPEWEQPRTYRVVARRLITMADDLAAECDEWIGGSEPRSPLRALDKYFWWAGGGSSGYAAVITDPWRAVRELGSRLT